MNRIKEKEIKSDPYPLFFDDGRFNLVNELF
jgi:hypothetical protein